MSPKSTTFITWQELYGRRPSAEMVKDDLRRLDRLQTALLLSQISIHIALDRFHTKASETIKLQRFLALNLFCPQLRSDIENRKEFKPMDQCPASFAICLIVVSTEYCSPFTHTVA